MKKPKQEKRTRHPRQESPAKEIARLKSEIAVLKDANASKDRRLQELTCERDRLQAEVNAHVLNAIRDCAEKCEVEADAIRVAAGETD